MLITPAGQHIFYLAISAIIEFTVSDQLSMLHAV